MDLGDEIPVVHDEPSEGKEVGGQPLSQLIGLLVGQLGGASSARMHVGEDGMGGGHWFSGRCPNRSTAALLALTAAT